MNNVLKPFFEIVNYIVMETDTELHVSITSYSTGRTLIAWWVGDSRTPDAGCCTSFIRSDDLDEDTLNRWIAELNAIAYPCQHCSGSNLKLDTDCDEHWCLDCDDWAYIGKGRVDESREQIARTENAILDKENS